MTTSNSRVKRFIPKTIIYVSLVLGTLAILAPFYWMLRTVIAPNSVLYQSGKDLAVIPSAFTGAHFQNVWSGGSTPFYIYVINSLHRHFDRRCVERGFLWLGRIRFSRGVDSVVATRFS